MYAWIWHKLPFGLRGKFVGSFALVASVITLLWFVIFPAIEPNMPFNDGQMDDTSEVVPSDGPAPGTSPAGGTGSVPVSPSRSNR